MAKYKLAESGVVRKSDGASIPNAEGNRDWVEYQEWLAEEDNTPDPEFTQEELDLNGINQEISELKDDLQKTQVWLFRMILAMWQIGVTKGVWDNSDITDNELKQKVAAWKTKLDRLLELGE